MLASAADVNRPALQIAGRHHTGNSGLVRVLSFPDAWGEEGGAGKSRRRLSVISNSTWSNGLPKSIKMVFVTVDQAAAW